MTGPAILLDVTLRDGGYVNGHSWSRAAAAEVVGGCAAARVPYAEVGYFRPRRHAADGAARPTACCPPDYLRGLAGARDGVALVAMAHARDVELADFARLRRCGVSMVRLPARVDVLPTLGAHVAAAKAAGLTVAVNLIRVSEVGLGDVARAARLAAGHGADVFYLADSNGSLFPEQVSRLVGVAAAASDVPLGFHAHDGLSLAFANSLAAYRAGCRWLDASLGGMGKGGGNLRLELIVGYLRSTAGLPVALSPLVRTAADVLRPWQVGVLDRCESMASGLLDLNLDTIAELRADAERELYGLIDAAPAADGPAHRPHVPAARRSPVPAAEH